MALERYVGAPKRRNHHSSEGTFDRQADGPTNETRRCPTDLAREAKTGRLWRAGPLAWGKANRPSKTTRNSQGNHRAQSTINKTVNLTRFAPKGPVQTLPEAIETIDNNRVLETDRGAAGRVAPGDGPTGSSLLGGRRTSRTRRRADGVPLFVPHSTDTQPRMWKGTELVDWGVS
jgi:hypothetical protein